MFRIIELKYFLLASALTVTAAQSQTLQGLYLQLQPVGTTLAHVHYYFWKDGRMCQGLPSGGVGVEPADYATYEMGVRKENRECGHYSISGSRMHLQWQTSPTYDASFVHFKNDSFEMNQYSTSKVGFITGQKLDGTYSATVVGDQMRAQVYVFHPDGSYQFTDKPVTSRDGAPAGAAGRYRVYGGTLELSGSSGSIRKTAYPFPDGGISIENTVFSR